MTRLSHRRGRLVPVRERQNCGVALTPLLRLRTVLLMQVTQRSAAETRGGPDPRGDDRRRRRRGLRPGVLRADRRAGRPVQHPADQLPLRREGRAGRSVVEHVIAGIGEHVGARVWRRRRRRGPAPRLHRGAPSVTPTRTARRCRALLQVVMSGAWGTGAGAQRREPPRGDPFRRSARRRDAALRRPVMATTVQRAVEARALPAAGRARPRLHGVRRRAGRALRPRDAGGSVTLVRPLSASSGRPRSTT